MSTLQNGLKELPPTGYLGIDFGTSTTHIAVCYLDGNLGPQAVPLGGKSSVTTCLLWKGDGGADDTVVAFGDRALRQWVSLKEDDRKQHRYAAVFKPDIASGARAERAQKDARAFLAKCYQAVRDSGVVRGIGLSEGMPVVIGIPAEIGREQKDLTARLAREAGFGEATAVEEPLGALAFHLADGTITGSEARRGVVVVDFGGGTLDVAWLDARRGLRAPWGDPTLGGRLFDDLFYQWLIERNPEIKLSERDRPYVWQATCRELKERFSDHWADEGGETEYFEALNLPGRQYAEFAGTPAEFLERAKRYRPSEVAADYFSTVGGRLAELGKSGPENLIELIRVELLRGLGGHPPDVARVILTGGSCKWPFMRDLAAQVFDLPKERVLRSPQPETTIGSGLAVYHVLKYRNAEKRIKLKEELPVHRRKFDVAVEEQLRKFSKEVAEAVVSPLLDQVEAIYLTWYQKGGTLNEVTQKVEAATKAFDVPSILQGRDALLARLLVRLLRDHLKVWMKAHGVDREVDEIFPEGSIVVKVPPLGDLSGTLATEISNMVGLTIVGVVTGTILAAAHSAHIVASPVTGLLTLGASATASFLGYAFVEDKVRNALMAMDWGPLRLRALSAVLSEQTLRSKINASRIDATSRVLTVLNGQAASPYGPAAPSENKWKTLGELRQAVVGQFESYVNQVIEDLGVLEDVRDPKAPTT